MVKWVCYPSGDKPDMWNAWFCVQDGAVRGRHATAMRFLSAGHWGKPHFKRLKGKHLKGLSEIIVGSGVEWRLIGHWDSAASTFTLTMICNHKDRVYKPTDAFEVAMDRWKAMKNGLQGITLDAHPS